MVVLKALVEMSWLLAVMVAPAVLVVISGHCGYLWLSVVVRGYLWLLLLWLCGYCG